MRACVCVCVCVCKRACVRACECAAAGALDWQDKHGRSCLMQAASRGLTGVVQSLLAAGANAGLTDALNYTSLVLACKHSHAEAAEVLIEATKLSGSIDCKALRSGATARTWATYNRLAGVIRRLDDAGAAATAGVDGNSLPFPCSAPVESPKSPSDESLDEDTVLLKITTAEDEGQVTKLPTDPQSLRSAMHDEATSFDFSLPTVQEWQFAYSHCKKVAGRDWCDVFRAKYFALNIPRKGKRAVTAFNKVVRQLHELKEQVEEKDNVQEMIQESFRGLEQMRKWTGSFCLNCGKTEGEIWGFRHSHFHVADLADLWECGPDEHIFFGNATPKCPELLQTLEKFKSMSSATPEQQRRSAWIMVSSVLQYLREGGT